MSKYFVFLIFFKWLAKLTEMRFSQFGESNEEIGSPNEAIREHIPYLQEQMVEIKMQVAAVTFSDPHSRAESHKNVQPCAASHLAARLD